MHACMRFVADLPEPEDLLGGARVVSVYGVPLPVGQIYLLHATQHHLQRQTHTKTQV